MNRHGDDPWYDIQVVISSVSHQRIRIRHQHKSDIHTYMLQHCCLILVLLSFFLFFHLCVSLFVCCCLQSICIYIPFHIRASFFSPSQTIQPKPLTRHVPAVPFAMSMTPSQTSSTWSTYYTSLVSIARLAWLGWLACSPSQAAEAAAKHKTKTRDCPLSRVERTSRWGAPYIHTYIPSSSSSIDRPTDRLV